MRRKGHIFEVDGANSEIIIVGYGEMQLRKKQNKTLKIIKMGRVIGGLFEVGDQ